MPSSATPFGEFLAERDIAVTPETLGEYISLARRLREKPEKVAPNSPRLPGFAAHIGVPLAAVQKFCKAPPMGKRWVEKIESQMGAGTLRHTHKRHHVVGKGNYKHPLARMAAEKGLSLVALAKKAGVKQPVVWRASTGKMPPNHPQLVRIAAALGVPTAELAKLQKAPAISGRVLELAERRDAAGGGHQRRAGKRGPGKGGKGVVLASVSSQPREQTNGTGPRKYNRLRKLELGLRESARALIATLNLAIMNGETHIPPLPVGDLHLFLQDYLREKGIKESILVDPKFKTVFDR